MPRFLNLSLKFRRWRHSRGFGVHSPFAFRFITEVLCLPEIYGYYSYLDIPRGELRTLFRVAVRLQPRKVAMPGCDNREVRRAVFGAAPKAAPADLSEADFVVFDARRNRKLPAGAIPRGANVFILNYHKWKEFGTYRAAMGNGMVFMGCHSAVAVALDYLPRQDFDVRF